MAATTSLNLIPKCHPDLNIIRVEFVALIAPLRHETTAA